MGCLLKNVVEVASSIKMATSDEIALWREQLAEAEAALHSVLVNGSVVHAFEPGRAGQYRGVSVLAPIIKRLRMLGRYDEAELQAAVLNAVMAAFVESPFDHDQFASALGGGEELSAYQQQRLKGS